MDGWTTGEIDGWVGEWRDYFFVLWHTENPAVSLLDIKSPKARLSLMLLWSRELSRGKGPEEKLRKGPGWEERDELTQVPALRSTVTI